MIKMIKIFSLVGILVALSLIVTVFLEKSPTPVEIVPSKTPFEDFPINQSRIIEFEMDEDAFARLAHREQLDQLRDWLLFTTVYASGLSEEGIAKSLYDVPTIRYGYTQPVANFEYDVVRSAPLDNNQVLALIPASDNPNERLDHLAHIADRHRKDLGTIPASLEVFEYEIESDCQFGELIKRETVDANQLFTEQAGYFTQAIHSLDDFTQFLSKIDDITFAQADGDQLIFGGRKIQSRNARNIQVEDVAAIWQSENKIQQKLAAFNKKWEDKEQALLDLYNNKLRQQQSKMYLSLTRERLQEEFDKEVELLRQEAAQEMVGLKLVNGSGFSLDPMYDYEGLIAYFEEDDIEDTLLKLASKDDSTITIKDITQAKNALVKYKETQYPEVPFLILIDKLKNSNDFLENLFGSLFQDNVEKFRFQTSRYDGELQGTEVGMVLFYTDLLAKLFRYEYSDVKPYEYVQDFKTYLNLSISPVYKQEVQMIPQTRLWFGPKNEGFQIVADNNLLFARNATRIYSASSSSLEPGKEVSANASAGTTIDWWNNHYEEVSRYEQEYERLNQIMKWSLLISWLNEANRGGTLSFLQTVSVEHLNWFPEWVRKKQALLKFQKWDDVQFYPRGYKGTTTEAMPILSTKSFVMFGGEDEEWVVSGGVSLADKALFNGRVPLVDSIDDILLRSNLDYSVTKAGENIFQTLEGIHYEIKQIIPDELVGLSRAKSDRISVLSRAKPEAKLRDPISEVVNLDFERISTQNPSEFSIATQIGKKNLGEFNIVKKGNGFKVGWRSRELDAGQSLARQISTASNPEQVLAEAPGVKTFLKLSDEDGYLVKMQDMDDWVKMATEKEPSLTIAEGFQSRVADPDGGKQNILVAIVDDQTVQQELKQNGYFVQIERDPVTGRDSWQVPPRGPPSEPPTAGSNSADISPDGSSGIPPKNPPSGSSSGVPPQEPLPPKNLLVVIPHEKGRPFEIQVDILTDGKKSTKTIKGFIDEQTKMIYLEPDEFNKTQTVITDADLQQIRSLANTPGLEPIYYKIPEPRLSNPSEIIGHLRSQEYDLVASNIAADPKNYRQILRQDLAERLTRSSQYIAEGKPIKALQTLEEGAKIHGDTPDIKLLRGIAQLKNGRNLDESAAILNELNRPFSDSTAFFDEVNNLRSSFTQDELLNFETYQKNLSWKNDIFTGKTIPEGKLTVVPDKKQLILEYSPDKPLQKNVILSSDVSQGKRSKILISLPQDSPGLNNIDSPVGIRSSLHQLTTEDIGEFFELPSDDVVRLAPSVISTDQGEFTELGTMTLQNIGGTANRIPAHVYISRNNPNCEDKNRNGICDKD